MLFFYTKGDYDTTYTVLLFFVVAVASTAAAEVSVAYRFVVSLFVGMT